MLFERSAQSGYRIETEIVQDNPLDEPCVTFASRPKSAFHIVEHILKGGIVSVRDDETFRILFPRDKQSAAASTVVIGICKGKLIQKNTIS
jgi:hypothetical protein